MNMKNIGGVVPEIASRMHVEAISVVVKKALEEANITMNIAANYIEFKELKPPFISMIISGGHTHLVDVKDYTNYEIIGRTMDDAVGEAFDKVARVVGLRISRRTKSR